MPEGHPENLPQGIADYLIDLAKVPIDPEIPIVLKAGMKSEVDFQAIGDREFFRIMIQRSRIDRRHAMYELIGRRTIVLLRFEIHGPPHTNPGELVAVPCPHLHRYREGYGAAYAEPASDMFGNPDKLVECLQGFLQYCNVVQVPSIREERGLL